MDFLIVETTYYLNNRLTAEINPALAAPTLFSAAKLGLGTGVISPGRATNIAALSEATFVGYAESATIVWGTPVNDAGGTLTTLSPSHLFRATAGTTPNAIANAFVTDGVASPNQGILGSARIDPALEIVNTGDGFSIIVAWNAGNPQVLSKITVIV